MIEFLYFIGIVVVVPAVLLTQTSWGRNFCLGLPLPSALKQFLGKQEKAYQSKKRAHEQELEKARTLKIQLLSHPQDQTLIKQGAASFPRHSSLFSASELIQVLEIMLPLTSSDPSVRRWVISSSRGSLSGNLYDLCLQLIEQNPDSRGLKSLALEVGRVHYSKNRKDKKPTIYDEQAINNDIAARSR
ncbi:MAG: hypothetical protein AAGD09_03560 [Cyanobacteria bacterium P01_F01_bin.56]